MNAEKRRIEKELKCFEGKKKIFQIKRRGGGGELQLHHLECNDKGL